MRALYGLEVVLRILGDDEELDQVEAIVAARIGALAAVFCTSVSAACARAGCAGGGAPACPKRSTGRGRPTSGRAGWAPGEQPMKINFTKKEYQHLVEMLQVAGWVLRGGIVDDEREETKPYRELREKVLSYHKEMGLAEPDRYAPERDEAYFRTETREDWTRHMELVQEYDAKLFWEMLVSRLVHRDLAAKDALCASGRVEEKERERDFYALTQRYSEEFTAHGLKNLRVVREAPTTH